MAEILETLSTSKVLTKYVHEGKEYGNIPGFKTHQVIWGSELKAKTRYPDFLGRTKDVLRTVELGVRSKELGDTDREQVPKKKHAFEKSPFFAFETFRSSLPEWAEEKCRHWWGKAKGYSDANGGRYLDWRRAVQNWDSEKPFVSKSQSGPNSHLKVLN